VIVASPAKVSVPTVFRTRPTVLVVDDDEDTVSLLEHSLERAGARVLAAYSGAQALRMTYEYRPDAVLLDILMPDVDGLTVCERLRDLSDMPIVMVTALDNTDQLTRAFKAGADDYLTKPFDMAELLIRIQACLRRAPKLMDNADNLVLGDGELIIDLQRRRVWVRQQDTHLTKTEFDLLVYLARNHARVLTHDMLRASISIDDSVAGQARLKQFIRGLRRKIEVDPRRPRWLVSEHGVGYALLLE